MQCADKKRIIEYLEGHMTEKRLNHIYAVVEEAKKLSRQYGEDVEKAEIAALFHDYFRGCNEDVLNEYIIKFGLPFEYLNNINLAHGKIAACIMEKDYGVDDQDILNAVRFHTTGRTGMSRLEKIIYLADAIEPNRKDPGLDQIRELAYRDLDEACFEEMNQSIEYIKKKGQHLDDDTVTARDSLGKLLKKGKGEGK